MAGRQGWNLRRGGPSRVSRKGPENPGWKGDSARPETKRNRAQRMYELGACEMCGKPAIERHHIDADTGNNERSNIKMLCRRCHMAEDGRLDMFRSTSISLRGPQPPKECSNCGKLSKPLRHGRCGACAEYLRRTGNERQRCHNRYDVEHRAETRKATIAANMGKTYPGWQQPLYLPEQEAADEH